jgi:hypothetical protein
MNMRQVDPGTQEGCETAAGGGYVRFIIIGDARTGSSMLVQALNSSPNIVCFREVFNGRLDFVDFSVDGYDNFSSRDIASRKEDPVRFLSERVFRRQPEQVRAVGFKFLYAHHWDFPGLLDELVADERIKVVHLRRRNALRMLVSLKLAQETGVWVEPERKVTQANLLKALRHPLKAAGRARRNLRHPEQPRNQARRRVTVSPNELFEYSVKSHLTAKKFDELFAKHEALPVFYEDLLAVGGTAFAEVQSFLGVEPAPVEITLRRQNPEPLAQLVENYDELYELMKDSPAAAFLE